MPYPVFLSQMRTLTLHDFRLTEITLAEQRSSGVSAARTNTFRLCQDTFVQSDMSFALFSVRQFVAPHLISTPSKKRYTVPHKIQQELTAGPQGPSLGMFQR